MAWVRYSCSAFRLPRDVTCSGLSAPIKLSAFTASFSAN